MKQPFQECFCEHFRCPPQEYADRVFRQCLYWHARPAAWWLARSSSSFFAEDMALIRDLAAVTTRGEAIAELNRFYGRNLRDKNWLRRAFALRISAKRVLRLYRMISRARRHQTA